MILLSSLTLFLSFNSCTKKASTEKDLTKSDRELIEKAIKKSQDPFSFSQTLNIQGKGYYGDISGSKVLVDKNKNLQRGINERSTCPELGDSEFSQEFVSIKRELTCGQGYRFEIKYKVTTEFYPINGISSTQFSFGRIRLKNSSGTVTYITPNDKRNMLISIKNNGVVDINSLGEDLNEFEIVYRTEYISESAFSSAASIEPMLFLYTDCANYPTMTIAFSPQQSTIGVAQNSQPCLRVDKINFMGGGGYDAMIWGANGRNTMILLCGCGTGDPTGTSSCYPSGYVFPTKQEIWYKNSSGTAWNKFYFMSYVTFLNTQTEFILPTDFFKIPISINQANGMPSSGVVEVKYRNHGLDEDANSCTTAPDDTWVYETWYF